MAAMWQRPTSSIEARVVVNRHLDQSTIIVYQYLMDICPSPILGGACGPYKVSVEDKGAPHPRGIFLDATLAPFGKVDAVLSLGVQLTPSSPTVGERDVRLAE